MELSTGEIFAQAIIAIYMISNPIDPVKILVFNRVVAREGRDRKRAALTVALVMFGILGVAALAGRELLQLIGIDLGAFSVVGGIIVAGMGFEMLYGGASTRANGRVDVEEDEADDGGADEGLIMPLSTPLMAGPGSITTVIAVSTFADDGTTLVAALVGVAVVSILAFCSFAFLGTALERLKPSTTALLARIGGLLLATIGVQLVLGGLKTYYGIT